MNEKITNSMNERIIIDILWQNEANIQTLKNEDNPPPPKENNKKNVICHWVWTNK